MGYRGPQTWTKNKSRERERWFVHTSILHNVLGTRIEPIMVRR